jgi:type IV pilus assembly protein PilB
MASRCLRKPIGAILLERGSIKPSQLDEALGLQARQPGKKLGEILMKLGYVSEKEILRAYADQLGTAYARNWAAWR